ncbi:MAG: M64 family metallopeptidase [Candidatus Pacearchaeota archaeon]
MKKITIILSLTIGIFIISIIFFSYIYFLSTQVASSPKQFLGNCNIIKYSGEHVIDIVIFADEKTAINYSNSLFEVSPFNSSKETFNFFYIDDYTPKCELYKGIALLCYSKELIKRASSCPNDYILVIGNSEKTIRSSAYMNVMSLNSQHTKAVFYHEFGHVFANLADEYIPAKIPVNSKNCVVSCDKFTEEIDGCFQGCSDSAHFRSIENGLMRTLAAKNYGVFNEMLMKEKLKKSSTSITAKAIEQISDCTKREYYLIEGVYSNEEIQVLNKSIETGCIGLNGAGDFSYRLILSNNVILTEEEFNPEFIFTDTPNQEKIAGEVFISDNPFYLKIPVIENLDSVQILKNNKVVSEINLKDIGARPCKNE